MFVQIKADPMVISSVPRLSLGWVRATANTLMEERIGGCHLSPLQSWRRERRME